MTAPTDYRFTLYAHIVQNTCRPATSEVQCIELVDRNHYRLLILLTVGLGTLSASFLGVMGYEDPNGLDYVDGEYDWNRNSADVSEAIDVEAEFLALLENGASEQAADDQIQDESALLADLDAALGEIESEIQAEAQEMARPSADAVELLPTWDRIYKVGSQNFICTDRITEAPKIKSTEGQSSRVRSDLSELLGQNLNRSRMARLKRKVD